MKTLTKLALVSAMAFSANAMAAQLQALDEEEMSAATGQDGITISLGGTSTILGADIVIHDRGGFEDGVITGVTRTGATGIGLPAAVTAETTNGKKTINDGAILLDNFAIKSATSGKIDVVIDADAGVASTAPVLNINIGLPSDLVIETGDIYVAKSNGIDAAGTTAAPQYSNQVKILDNISVSLGGAKMNIQLGNAPQGALIKLTGTISGGLSISNLNILQGVNGIGIGKLNIKTASTGSTAGTDWALTANVNATNTGLEISNLGTVDLRLENVRLGNLTGLTAANAPLAGTGYAGSTKAIGQVALMGLALPNVTISGH